MNWIYKITTQSFNHDLSVILLHSQTTYLRTIKLVVLKRSVYFVRNKLPVFSIV